MKIVKKNNCFFYEFVGIDKNGEVETTYRPVIEIAYGYTRRNKQNYPTTTIAVKPEIRDGQLVFGIGVAFCSKSDMPVKKDGRDTATNRALGTLCKSGDIDSKPDAAGATRLLGMFTPWEDAHIAIHDLDLDLEVTTRIAKALTYLHSKCEA